MESKNTQNINISESSNVTIGSIQNLMIEGTEPNKPLLNLPSKLKDEQDALKNQIGNGDIEAVFISLEHFFKQKSNVTAINTLTLLSSAYYLLKRQENTLTISLSEAIVERQRIVHALLNLIDESM